MARNDRRSGSSASRADRATGPAARARTSPTASAARGERCATAARRTDARGRPSDDADARRRRAASTRDRLRELTKLGHANILVIGQTGVGKSTLINAIFRKPLARRGHRPAGRPRSSSASRTPTSR